MRSLSLTLNVVQDNILLYYKAKCKLEFPEFRDENVFIKSEDYWFMEVPKIPPSSPAFNSGPAFHSKNKDRRFLQNVDKVLLGTAFQ
jgi:hypothetical protein